MPSVTLLAYKGSCIISEYLRYYQLLLHALNVQAASVQLNQGASIE